MPETSNFAYFPPSDVPVEEKTKKPWCMQFAKAMNSYYNNNQTGICYNDAIEFRRLRAYGDGRQDPTQYMSLLGINKQVAPQLPTQTVSDINPPSMAGNDFARKGYMNISWKILPIIPKFREAVIGIFENIDHNIYADGIDEKSSAEKQNAKMSMWVEMEFKDFFAKFEQESGVKGQKPEYLPESMQELEMFSAMGGFKLKSEMAIEAGIRYTMDISEWKEIKKKLIKDEFDIGCIGTRDYVDPFTQKVKVAYVDPEYAICPYDKNGEYKDIPFGGEYRWYTIADLRSMNNIITGEPEFTEKELTELAKVANANRTWNSQAIGTFTYSTALNMWNYDGLRILVLDCEYKSDDYKYVTAKLDDEGNVRKAFEDEYGKVKNRKKSKTQKTKCQMVYKCKWVVGTEIAWDYGHQFDIPRPTPSECNLSFHFHRVTGPSKCSMITALADAIQLSWLKLQNAKATSRPNGVSIEYSSLTNVSMANGKMQPLEILKIFNETGNLLYSTTTQRGYNPTGIGNSKPINEIRGGMGTQQDEYERDILMNLNLIRDITGINNIADGSSPTPDALVGVTEMAMQATSNVLKPLLSTYLMVKERTCKNVALRIQLLVKFNKTYKLGYYSVFGMPMTETLEIGAEINNAMFGIRIEARPDAMEKQKILEAAQVAMQVGRDGVPIITLSDWLMVQRFVENGALKYATAFLAYRESQAAKKSQEQKKELVDQQNQGNLALKQQESDSQQQLIQITTQLKTSEITAQSEADVALEMVKHKNKMEEIALTQGMQGDTKLKAEEKKGETKIQETVIKSAVESEQSEREFELEKDKAELDNEFAEKEHGRKMELSDAKIKEMKSRPKTTPAKK